MNKLKLVTTRSSETDSDPNLILTHLPSSSGQSDIATLCGLADDGDCHSATVIPTPKGQKVDCPTCIAMWNVCRSFRKSQIQGDA